MSRVNCELNDEEQLGSKQADALLSVLRYEAQFLHELIILDRYLVDQNSFIDSSKIGIQGAHYGGFLIGRVLEKDAMSSNPLISCAIMQNPIVEWRNYGTLHVVKLHLTWILLQMHSLPKCFSVRLQMKHSGINMKNRTC